ncbi:MAG: peptidylprolyl isomerase [Bryobacteraceae bacterium]
MLSSLLLLNVCLAQQTTPAAPASGAPIAPATEPPKRDDGLYVKIQTSMGTIIGRLFEKEAPVTVKNFQDLALGRKTYIDPRNGLPSRKPLYNGLTFHRVIPEFMIQGGDPLGTGMGGTTVIKDEIVPELKFDQPGRFGMANAGPNTGSCQFFITEVATPHLDGLHTIFGQVVEGLDLVLKIARVPSQNDRPIAPVRILSVTFERVGVDPNKPPPPPARPAPKPLSKGGPVVKKSAPGTAKK